MNKHKKWFVFLLLLLLALVMAGTAVYADISATYSISRSVVAGGGQQNSTGGSYSLSGTAGQAAAQEAATGGSYTLTSGFWNGSDGGSGTCIEVTDTSISGPSFGQPNELLVYHVTTLPANATPPITFTWSGDGFQSQTGNQVTYMWTDTGAKVISYSVEDCDNTSGVGNGMGVTIGGYRIFLPLISK